MPVIIHQPPEGEPLRREFSTTLRIGSAEDEDLRLPEESRIAPHHAMIARSEHLQAPVLIDLTRGASPTLVNGRRVTRLKVLRHRDRIQLGQARLEFWELIVRTASADSGTRRMRCLVCYQEIEPGDRYVLCPRCSMPHHQECWLDLSDCAYIGCGYPVQKALRRVLSPVLPTEVLEEESELVKDSVHCSGGEDRDVAPFKAGECVARCPDCDTPFHFKCWLGLPECPNCRYGIGLLVESLLVPETDRGRGEGEESRGQRPD